MSAAPLLPEDEPVSMPSAPTVHGGDPDAIGRIDHYDLLRKLGGGGFGVVYLARDSVSGVEVAIKTLHPLLKHNAEEMDLLREKFRLVHGLTHPNIAKALVIHLVREINVWDDDARAELKLSPGDSVMVMDYAPGVTLSKWRRQFPGGVVPFDLALEVGRQVAAALDYAHSERIVHRDVKPGNIMVETLDGGRLRVRILDFGLAAEIRSSMSRVSTETGDTSGTRPYMAPEQWLGKKQDGRTDQYALACVLYELLSGAPPFAGVFETGDPAVMMAAIKSEAPDSVPSLPRAANTALLRALAKDPATRFPTCTAFVEALCQGRGVSTIRPPRHAGWIAAAALLAAVAGVFLTQSPRRAQSPVTPPPVVESHAETAESAEGRARSNPFSPDPSSGGASRPGAPRRIDLGSGVSLEMVACPGVASDFWMGKYEVTQEQWQRVMGSSPSYFKGAKNPVENVSWNDCQEFIQKLNALPSAKASGLTFRLPKKAEWKMACRAGATGKYCRLADGTEITEETLGRVAWFSNNSNGQTHPVGEKEPNAWGLYDMNGNVWEWTETAFGEDRVGLGGSWYFSASGCEFSNWNWDPPFIRRDGLGFRLCASGRAD